MILEEYRVLELHINLAACSILERPRVTQATDCSFSYLGVMPLAQPSTVHGAGYGNRRLLTLLVQ